ncbi:hypothetical protein MOMA_02165 [Moraxella macacae 0408225]|uniref:Uncharacterized protein n=1 Tax=Moraxella macacae 0408225 TaxID=1230338 RepID=L2F7Y6_9GAMM|nr:hypothetical protein [Moraxella macacae]ELA09174.1 hypothetical protein MOMA_02165 [Moraxella macacae 0408225]
MSPELIRFFTLRNFKSDNKSFLALAELDYADKYCTKFGFPIYPYTFNPETKEKDLQDFENEISNWLEKDRVEALNSIRNNRKMLNPYKDWTEVPFEYLNIHYTGFSGLDAKGFFYTPAVIYNVLERADERLNSAAVLWWFFRLNDEFLKYRSNDLLKFFNDFQLTLLIEFLNVFGNGNTGLTSAINLSLGILSLSVYPALAIALMFPLLI